VGQVLIGGRLAPVRGRVCMNMTMVDVTGIPGVVPGTIATLIGRDGAREISADDLAERMGSISYEAVARIGLEQPRLFRLADGRLLQDDQQLAAALAAPRSAADAGQPAR
jgi:alanine racemase